MASYEILQIHAFLLPLFFQIVIGAYVEVGNLPATVSVAEDPAGATFLYSVVSYPTTASCVLTGSDAANFNIALVDFQHKVSTIASPSFDQGTDPSYSLVVECSSSGVTAAATLTVNIVANSAPVYTNLPGAVSISAKTVRANHVIYTVSYTDTDTHPPLTYSGLATSDIGGPFSIADDQLTVTADLETTNVTFYRVAFDVTDGRSLTSQYINVTINDINSAPIFVGANDVTQPLAELTSGRLLIYDIDYADADGDYVQFAYATVDAANSIFDLVGATGEIYLQSGNTLDYETTSMYTFLVTVSDYLATQATTFTLTLNVTNVNEAPTYTGPPNAVTVNESTAGAVIGTLSELCTDPDGTPPDNISYSILFSTYSSYFTVDSVTAEVSLAATWDYDSATLPESVNITVRCQDIGGFSDDATFSITFLDINDNDPVCSPSTTTYHLAYSQTVNETILNLKCSDDDNTVNADLNYTTIGLSSGYSVAYFDIDANGNVSIKIALDMRFNTTFYVTVLVTDNGDPTRSSTVTLTVSYTQKPLDISYTYDQPCLFCTSGAITLVSALSLVALMLLILAVVLGVLRCCYAWERRKIKESLSKKKKKKWRLCGCCRPDEIKKPKKSKEEIEKAEKEDREYMRARNALLGAEDPQRGIEKQWRKAAPTLPSSEKARLHSQRRHTPEASSSGRGAPTVSTEISFRGRDNKPVGAAGASVGGIESLTEQQKQGIEILKEMQRATGGNKPGPSRQPASDMVWSFHGRDIHN